MSQLQYLPLSPSFFLILAGLLVFLFILIQVGVLHYVYTRLGLSPGAALLLLTASLVGSYLNIPVVQLAEERVVSGGVIDYFGMSYVVPMVTEWPGMVIAVNVGGAVIPTAISIYLLVKKRLWGLGLIGTAIVAVVCFMVAEPVPGLGIALPLFVPIIVTVIVALLLSRREAAPLAYISGSLGTLIGADLLNFDKFRGLGTPVASIGGAGTFDGVFLVGLVAVLIAGLSRTTDDARSPQA
jgi:uncharacterized membrane protein